MEEERAELEPVEVSPEAVAEPAGTPEATPAEEKPTPSQPTDFSAELASMRREIAEAKEEARRARQSAKDSAAALREQVMQEFEKQRKIIDAQEQRGILDADTAKQERSLLYQQIETDTATAAVKEKQQREADEARQAAEAANARIRDAHRKTLLDLGTDAPELAMFPDAIPPGLGAKEAADWYEGQMSALVASKKKRLAQVEKDKAAKLQQAQGAAVLVDLGGGASSHQTKETIEKELEEWMATDPPSDPTGFAAYRRRGDELEAQLKKAGSWK